MWDWKVSVQAVGGEARWTGRDGQGQALHDEASVEAMHSFLQHTKKIQHFSQGLFSGKLFLKQD